MEILDLGENRATGAHPLIYKGLTVREVEVLKWSAQGKTAAEVAIILDLKPRTINFHIGSAIRKIGVTNKTSAVVKAALSGAF